MHYLNKHYLSKNYVIYHLHSDISNLTAGQKADSATPFYKYVDKAKELGMTAMAFSEHGSVINWIKKKAYIESAGMKYIHANEVYLTETLDEKIRDNYHYMLIAKNYDGVLELNELTSASFNKEDGHSYFNPRISFEELMNTSDNILMTSACLASPLWRMMKKSDLEQAGELAGNHFTNKLDEMLNWMIANKHRMFLELQYHTHPEQLEFNRRLMKLAREHQIPIIAGTDTHSLDIEHADARKILLKSKGAEYGNEDDFDLTMKSYDELVEMYRIQGVLTDEEIYEAIENTNVMADMVEEFTLDKTAKYPKIYENPVSVFKEMINSGVKWRGIDKFSKEKREMYYARIKEEMETYLKVDAVDYMLLQKNIIDWCYSKGIYHGYGRGSVTGSLIAYVLGIHEMDSIKHKLNFFRFLNPERISLPDIDIDFPPARRQEVIDYLASLEGIEFSEIITINTSALKGSIRIVGKALDMDLDTIDIIAKQVEVFNGKNHIDKKVKAQYPELFKYVDILNGVVTSMGSHPSGFIVSPIDLRTHVSTLYTKESKYQVTAVNMKELDGENFVKLDILGLDNIELINDVCKLADIDRLIPDNIDTDDIDVWKSLQESTLGVFQFESDSAFAYLKQLFSDQTLDNIKHNVGDVSYIDLLSMANGAIRPSGKSYRDALAQGIPNNNGHEALNDLLKDTLGFMIFQEQIMRFLTDLCEHSGAESDSVRRGLSKKIGTEQFLPKITEGFVSNMVSKYGEDEEHAHELLVSSLRVISDASDYGFSVNHSSPYSYTGYACAWLRYYYPLEFLTVALNLQDDDKERTAKIMHFAHMKDITIKQIEFGGSRGSYDFDLRTNTIYKGIASIKYLNEKVANELYELAHANTYDNDNFVSLLKDIILKTSVNSMQMKILIGLNFFKQFNFTKESMLEIYETMTDKKKADVERYPEFAPYIGDKGKLKTIPLKFAKTLKEKSQEVRYENMLNYQEAVKQNPPRKVTIHEQLAFEMDSLGSCVTTFPEMGKSLYVVMVINKKYTPVLTMYNLKTGEEVRMKVAKKKFYADDDCDMIYIGDVIEILETKEKPKWKMSQGEDGKSKWIENHNDLEEFLELARLVRSGRQREELTQLEYVS